MRRIAMVGALFALQAPLCAIACLDASMPTSPASQSEHGEMACHGGAPAKSPREPSEHADDCGCGESLTATLASTTRSIFEDPTQAALPSPTATRLAVGTAPLRTIGRLPRETDLPPPDLLLLESTLLL